MTRFISLISVKIRSAAPEMKRVKISQTDAQNECPPFMIPLWGNDYSLMIWKKSLLATSTGFMQSVKEKERICGMGLRLVIQHETLHLCGHLLQPKLFDSN